MTDGSSPPRLTGLAMAAWPSADAAAWQTACTPQAGPFGHPRHSPATDSIYAKGYGFYLSYLKSQGWLDPAETLAGG